MSDAGIVFYQMDFWNMWNMAIIGTGIAFVIASESSVNDRESILFCLLINECAGVVGLVKESDSITDLSFDILSLEALFLVPRQVLAPANL